MAISNSMKFRIDTLIDITNTSSRRQDDDKYAYRQEANFQTLLQTIGLRVNLNYDKSPRIDKLSVVKSSFGDKYKGKQNVWSFDFEVEFEGAIDLAMLTKDFDLIPIIIGLDETITADKALFRTKGKDKNITFSIVD